ncbi:MAG: hypothetical protein GTO40_22705, partial [Deltaproteobacteria bacterium]|nr:hypothetical protein [Deltaproteobacteria bacterium]
DLVISRHWQIGIVILGILLSVLPIIAPRYFFWSVWVGPFLLIDIINHRLRRDSILQDCAQGMYRRTLVIVTAGFLCGFFWEFWNYWAYTKWIYTVPIWDMPPISLKCRCWDFWGLDPLR